jgi:hypothetical protein
MRAGPYHGRLSVPWFFVTVPEFYKFFQHKRREKRMSILAKLVRRTVHTKKGSTLSRAERNAFRREFEEAVTSSLEKVRRKKIEALNRLG